MNRKADGHSFKYRAYLLREWCEGEGQLWRASLPHAGTGKKSYFATPERLCLVVLSLDDAS